MHLFPRPSVNRLAGNEVTAGTNCGFRISELRTRTVSQVTPEMGVVTPWTIPGPDFARFQRFATYRVR